MSDFASRLLRLPETNVEAWDKINLIIKSNAYPLPSKVINISHYIPGIDQWEFADINESKQRAINEIIRWQPLGGDHFPQWLKDDEVHLPAFNHPADPAYIAAYLEIHWLCGVLQVGHEITFCESENSWYWSINSAAQSESFVGKNYILSSACACALEHLFKIGKDYLIKERGLSVEGTTGKDEVTDVAQFFIAINSGRVNLTAGSELRGKHYVVGIKDIVFTEFHGGRQVQKPTDFKLIRVDADIDQLQYRLTLDGKDVGMMQFDYGSRTVEWDIEKRFIGTGVAYTAILSKTKP
jgi:hypothetical protein